MNSQKFLNLYLKLENLGKEKYQLKAKESKSIIAQMQDMQIFRQRADKLKYIRELRNFFIHEEKPFGYYPIEPVDKLIEFIEEVIAYVENPPRAFDKCIKMESICSAKKQDLVYPLMLEMKKKVYTHIPIIEDKIVTGVFSENTLFGILLEEEMIFDINNVTFEDPIIFKHCQINNHVSEVFRFIKRDTYIEEVYDVFNDSFTKTERLSMLFITEHGKANEKLLGILTPWDVLGQNIQDKR
jgi:predicted transcriptional regulator